jgi:hypothetical protein
MMEETLSRDSWIYRAATQRHTPNFPKNRDVRVMPFFFALMYQEPLQSFYSDSIKNHLNHPRMATCHLN